MFISFPLSLSLETPESPTAFFFSLLLLCVPTPMGPEKKGKELLSGLAARKKGKKGKGETAADFVGGEIATKEIREMGTIPPFSEMERRSILC